MAKRPYVPVHIPAFVVVAMVLFGACTGEEPVEIDLNATIPPTSAMDPDDPNAAQRAEIQDLAEQQCLDDPELAEGTVRIVDTATNEVVSELIIQCDTVR